MSFVGNKQKSKTSKLKTATLLTKPKNLVTINPEIKTSDDRRSLKRVRGVKSSVAICTQLNQKQIQLES